MFSVHQLYALRSLLAQGWPGSMVDILLSRCGLDQAGWQQLVDAGYIEADKHGKLWLSGLGKKVYRLERKTRHDF